jgi:hypothetical protein
MVVYDYLINNTIDRHVENYLMVENPSDGSLRVGIIDHGLAFGGWDNSEPRFQSFSAWHRGDRGPAYRADSARGGWNASEAALRVAGSPEGLESHVRSAIAGFDKVDPEAVSSRLRAEGLSPEQDQLVTRWMDQFRMRREWLHDNVDDVVETMVNRAARA